MRLKERLSQTKTILFFTLLFLSSCSAQVEKKGTVDHKEKSNSAIENYINSHPDDGKASVSKGVVSNGSLVNGKLMPYSGANFQYFADNSFLMGRAFVHSAVRKTLIDSYHSIQPFFPAHTFYIMESSNKCGGKLDPHKTHQNGLSVDFMMPLLKDGKEYNGLDTLGVDHYYLNFDDSGKYTEDASIEINFDIVAKHILELDSKARENGLKISKVIIKIELKDELFHSKYGAELIKRGIYVVQNLTPIINMLHDEHYHIDFELIK